MDELESEARNSSFTKLKEARNSSFASSANKKDNKQSARGSNLTADGNNSYNPQRSSSYHSLTAAQKPYEGRFIAAKESIERNTNAVMFACLAIITISIIFTVVGGLNIRSFVEHTTEVLNPPPGSQAFEAQRAFEVSMPSAADVSYFNVFVTYSGHYISQSNPPTADQREYGITSIPTLCNFLRVLDAHLKEDARTAPCYQHTGDYCELMRVKMNRIGEHLVSPSNQSLTVPITCNATRFEPQSRAFGKGLEALVAELVPRALLNATAFAAANWTFAPARSDFVVGINGLSIFLESIAATSKKDLLSAMSVIMPLLAVMCWLRLRASVALTIAVFYAAGGHFCAALGVMSPIADDMNVSSPTPLLMFCLGIGLSLLFSLLLVTDFVRTTRAYFDRLFFAAANAEAEAEAEAQDDASKNGNLNTNTSSAVRAPPSTAATAGGALTDAASSCAPGASSSSVVMPSLPTPPENAVIEFDDAIFHEHLHRARTEIIVDVIGRSCGAISVASLTLMLSLVCIVFFPASVIQSLGIGCMFTVACAWFFACPVLAALLYAGFVLFGAAAYPSAAWNSVAEQFVSVFGSYSQCACTCASACGGDDDVGDDQQEQEGGDVGGGADSRYDDVSSTNTKQQQQRLLAHRQQRDSDDGDDGDDDDDDASDGFFARWARLSAGRKAFTAVRFLIVLTIFCLHCFELTQMRLSNGYVAYLGRDASATRDFKQFVREFGFGFTSPYRILIRLAPRQDFKLGIFDTAPWDAAQQIARQVLDDPVLGGQTHMAGPIVVGPHLQNRTHILECLPAPVLPDKKCPDDSVLAFLFAQTAKDWRAMYLMMTAKFNPLGPDGYDMYQRILDRTRPQRNASTPGVPPLLETFVQGTGPSSLDCVHAIYERTHFLAPAAVAVAAVVVLLVLRSPLNALRFAYGLGVTLTAALALPLFVYQDGRLDALDIPALHSIGDTPWILPPIAFATALGLATAFDVLWTMTVCKPRRFADSCSMYFLALVVFVAFFGLALSTVPLMNMMGFSLCTATLFAGFIVPNVVTAPMFQLMRRALVKE